MGDWRALESSGDFQSRFESNASNSDAPGDREADVFLGGGVRAGAGGIWDRDWRWQAALVGQGEAATRSGDVVSYAIPPQPDLVAVQIAQANSNAFGAERVVYRVISVVRKG